MHHLTYPTSILPAPSHPPPTPRAPDVVFKYIGAQIAPLRIDVEQNTATRLVRLVAQLQSAWGEDADGSATSATSSSPSTGTAPAAAAASTSSPAAASASSTVSATSIPAHDGALLQLPPSTAAAPALGLEGGMSEGGWGQVEGEWAEAEAEAEAEAPLMLYVREMHLESVVITATIYIAALCDEVRPRVSGAMETDLI